MLTLLFLISSIKIPDIDYKSKYLELYIKNKPIEYRLGGIWPKYYDCGWIVTEAYRKMGYKWFKLNSHFSLMDKSCIIPLNKSKAWDVLINSNPWQWHVALITNNIGNKVEILDYVNTHRHSSYRFHSSYSWVFALSKNCLLNQKYWLQIK